MTGYEPGGEPTPNQRGKGDAEKLTIAMRLRRETTVTLAWIAERLQMGTKTRPAHRLYWNKLGGKTHQTID